MAVYFIADTHFGHANIIRFCDRPFQTLDEMNGALVRNWNARVKDADDIYIVGDFAYRSSTEAAIGFLHALNGRKHLVAGNHDMAHLKKDAFRECFVEVREMQKLAIDGVKIVLCHYPMAEWDGYFGGTYHVYGHIHNSRHEAFEFMRTKERALNAGVDVTGFRPVTFRELVACNEADRASLKTGL